MVGIAMAAKYLHLCSGCGKDFNSEGAFNRHRTGSFSQATRRCRTTLEMQAIGMLVNDRGRWVAQAYRDFRSSSGQEEATIE